MDLFKDNQKRYEIKFLINSKEKRELIDKNQLKKLFPDRIVESVYFDTEDLQFFNLSEEGITPRFKIRIRGYNNKKKEFKGSKINVKNFDCKQYATLKQSDSLSEINISKEN